MNRPVQNYRDFVDALLRAGFSMGGGSSDGIYAVVDWSWSDPPPGETPVRWHTGDAETDPWEWRMRVLDEREDISYAKVFFKKSGFITRDWAPSFLAARRSGRSFEEVYAAGKISHAAKRIYETVAHSGTLPLHGIKQLAGFDAADKALFDKALVELQMQLFLTMCGRQQKLSQVGEEYGWSSTVFCTTERFWGEEVFDRAAGLTAEAARQAIAERILLLNPQADEKKTAKFILG